MNYTLLIVPGLGDSSIGHWQNHWLEHFSNAQKVTQKDWNQPILDDWLLNLDSTIQQIDGPIILVAHSLAAVLVAHWSQTHYTNNVVGALLVAPADVDSHRHTPVETWNFAPIPVTKLNFPSVVVTSADDPYIDLSRAQFLAEKWNSKFHNVGNKGHLNAASQLELWQEGQTLLNELLQEIKANKY
ncbi:MAG: alpha/beta hydrolase [Bacteroidetes bacterium]|nr:alpha/beta hydrolase [Bacteroidota bacterium]